ncbi:hypothetical protein [Roseicyclus amphidinii]|uniref:hypothetical protein n=1 Tax=Roseicyclus amphidinii TaxID=3034232 RepID=UPI0024E14D1D|nr:hypothetical protein [Roseicyclus sp. Amp-Y-6]
MAGYLGKSVAAHSLLLSAIRAGFLDEQSRRKVHTCNLSPEEIAERDRPMSRQERRQMERLAAKGRSLPGRDG